MGPSLWILISMDPVVLRPILTGRPALRSSSSLTAVANVKTRLRSRVSLSVCLSPGMGCLWLRRLGLGSGFSPTVAHAARALMASVCRVWTRIRTAGG